MPLNFEERQVEEPQDSDAWASFDEQIYNRFAKTGDYVSGGYDGTKSIPNPQQNWDYRTAELGMNGEQLPYGAESWDAFGRPYYGEGLKGYWNGVVARVTSPTQLNAEFRKSDGDEDFLEWGARALYNAGEFGKLSDTTGVDSPLTYALRVSKEIVGGGLKLLELGGIAIERGIGTAVLANQTETLDEAFQASRIFYSTLLDTTLTSQFLQEYRKGQNPELLAQELANPFAEFVGQAILDPLNFVTWMGKAAKATDLVSDAAVIADKVGDALDATRALDAADDAADYAKATETLVDAVKAEFAAIRTTKLRQEYKVGAVVATGRQSHFFTRVSDNIAGIAQALKKLNGTGADVVEHLHELARAASPVEEVANSAIPFLAKSEIGRSLLSNNGLELGVYLNKIIGEGDDAKSFISAISGLQDNLPELIKFFGEKGRKTAQELFPTISDMQEADKLRKTAIAAGDVVSDKTHKIADMLKEVPTAIKWISNRDSSLQKVFKPINNFFGQVYMGASPGFAARN
ncbi:MAG: hypothetical protein GY755_10470, partial [Chloroflexi bacterium]|nr:hypothetical protein [Chloroflexota bacterium]